jgi:hypothetical protein
MHQAQLFVYFEMVFKAPSPCEEEQDCKRRSNFISLVCAHLIVIYLFVFYWLSVLCNVDCLVVNREGMENRSWTILIYISDLY